MEYWLQRAKQLDFGRHTKIQCCATDNSLRIEHNAQGYRGFCFRCKQTKFEPHGVLSLSELSKRREAVNAILESKSLYLPQDLSSQMPNYAAAWLLRAGIPLALAEKYGIGFSAKLDRVVLPVYRDKELIAYTMRSTTDKPKYIERQQDETAIFYSRAETILEPEQVGDYGLDLVVTEDILSAIRVGRIVPAAALLGTSVSSGKVHSLLNDPSLRSKECLVEVNQNHVPRIGIWLDADKAGRTAARRLESRLELQGCSVLRIRTDKDPKRYSNREIKEILNGDRRYFTAASEASKGLRSPDPYALGQDR